MQFAQADSLYESGQYLLASIGYERLLYFTEDPMTKAYACLKRAYCYKNLNQFDKIPSLLSRVDFSGINDSLLFSVLYEKALANYLIGNYQDAQSGLLMIDNLVSEEKLVESKTFLNVLILGQLYKWDEINQLLEKQKDFLINEGVQYDSLVELVIEKHPQLKDPQKALLLSSFVPGAGQFYAGYKGEAVLSFGLNILAFGIAGVLMYNRYYITGYAIGIGMIQKFYYGGRLRAEYLAEKRNAEEMKMFEHQLKGLLFK